MRQDPAREALTRFLTEQAALGRRCVLVVTGKGLGTRRGSDWSVGAIRAAVPDWLNTPNLREIVLSYSYAQPQHEELVERIAREGRKFGLGLVLSSQRPSELSPTVLSQCNTFLLHRISNDRDQELVHRLVPDNLQGLLRELPSLPSQSAILLGWASELPVLVRMNDLPKAQQPRSDDPEFWGVWVGKDDDGKAIERECDWKSIADDWQASHGDIGNEES